MPKAAAAPESMGVAAPKNLKSTLCENPGLCILKSELKALTLIVGLFRKVDGATNVAEDVFDVSTSQSINTA